MTKRLSTILASFLLCVTSVFGQLESVQVNSVSRDIINPLHINFPLTSLYYNGTEMDTILAGYQPLDGDLTSLSAAAGTNTLYYRSAAETWSPVTIGTGITFSGGTLSSTGSFTPAALTKTDDTNVTLTLGGTPSTALLQATSLTLGWTGQLGLSRGGTGLDASAVTDGQILIGQTSGNTFGLSTITAGTGISVTNAGHSITIASTGVSALTHTVTFVVDGSGSVIGSGTKAYIKIPYGGTLQGWTLIGSPSGSITLDIYRAADGGGLPSSSIIGGSGTKPALSSAVENSSTSFTSWTSTTLTAKDNLAINVSSVTSTTYVALTLYFQ